MAATSRLLDELPVSQISKSQTEQPGKRSRSHRGAPRSRERGFHNRFKGIHAGSRWVYVSKGCSLKVDWERIGVYRNL